jgi:hypothetical protein
LGSPSRFSVALSCFISFGHSSTMIIIRQDVFFKFMKQFIKLSLASFVSSAKLLVLESDP